MFRVGGKSVATEVGSRKRIHTTWEGVLTITPEVYGFSTSWEIRQYLSGVRGFPRHSDSDLGYWGFD